jgi:hypothetical protein
MFLRRRDQYLMKLPPPSYSKVDGLIFYNALATAILPNVLVAARALIDPDGHATTRGMAELMLSLLQRYESLLIAHDSLGWLDQLEGYRHGNNGTLVEQMYHLQYSLILFSGCLDTLALAIFILGGVVASDEDRKRKSINWRGLLVDRGKKLSAGLNEVGDRMVRAARSHPAAPLGSLVYGMRDSLQHRHPMRAGIAQIWGHNAYDYEANLAVIDLRRSLAQEEQIPLSVPGELRVGDDIYLVPYRFQRGVLLEIGRLVNEVIGAGGWTDSEWWKPIWKSLIFRSKESRGKKQRSGYSARNLDTRGFKHETHKKPGVRKPSRR